MHYNLKHTDMFSNLFNFGLPPGPSTIPKKTTREKAIDIYIYIAHHLCRTLLLMHWIKCYYNSNWWIQGFDQFSASANWDMQLQGMVMAFQIHHLPVSLEVSTAGFVHIFFFFVYFGGLLQTNKIRSHYALHLLRKRYLQV